MTDTSNQTATSIPTEAVPSELEVFAQKLAAEQQPLGEDFARVLEENLWELYVRS